MDIQQNPIPDLHIERIGNKSDPQKFIRGFITLPTWNGYYLYDDSYKLKSEKVVTNGRIDLWVDGKVNEADEMLISNEQITAYWYLVEHQEKINRFLLDRLKQEFPNLLSTEYAYWDHDDPIFPKLSDLTEDFDFRDYIGPESIHIDENVKDGIAYIIFHFRCRWDSEHGFDVTIHKERVIEIASNSEVWNIYKDNGTYEKEMEEFNKNPILPNLPKKKNWWQFW